MAILSFPSVYRGNFNPPRDICEDTVQSDRWRAFNGRTTLFGPSGDRVIEEIVEERLETVGASATGTTTLFAPNSDVLGFGYEIEQTIVGATSFLIGDNTGADPDRLFAAQTTYTAGTKKQAAKGAAPGAVFQGATGDNVKLTWTGTGTSGRVRVWMHRKVVVTYPAA